MYARTSNQRSITTAFLCALLGAATLGCGLVTAILCTILSYALFFWPLSLAALVLAAAVLL